MRIDRKRKFPITSLLRIRGGKDEKHILGLFESFPQAIPHLTATFAKDHAKTGDEAFIEIHKRLRDGEIGSVENAKEFINSIFESERYDLSKVGRFRFNKRFGKSMGDKEMERRTISLDDLVTIISHVVSLNNNAEAMEDDIDHLGSRRVRFVGELFQQKIRVGMAQIKRNIQDRMSTVESDAQRDNTVVEDFRKGYLLNDRILRPSLVSVAKKKEGAESGEE